MARNVRKASRFVRIAGSHANIMNESVDLLFEGEDGAEYAIEIDHSIVSAVLAAITGESRELYATLPALVDQPKQDLQVDRFSLSAGDDGSLAWRITLQGDIHFDLSFSPKQFDHLDELMVEAKRRMSR